MKTIEISGSKRTDFGKKSSKLTRKEGNVPCVIYGKEGNIHFYTPEANFRNIIYTADAHFIKLNLEGETYMLILQDTQFHPVTDKLLHADFIQITEHIPITMSIPVHVYGDSAAVKAGAKLLVKTRRLKVKALAENMPESISIDISNIKINHSIRVANLSIDNLTFVDPKALAIVTIASSRVTQKVEETGEASAEAAAPAAAPAK